MVNKHFHASQTANNLNNREMGAETRSYILGCRSQSKFPDILANQVKVNGYKNEHFSV